MSSQVLSVLPGQNVFLFSLLGALVGVRPVTTVRGARGAGVRRCEHGVALAHPGVDVRLPGDGNERR